MFGIVNGVFSIPLITLSHTHHPLAPLQNVLESSFKIARVPGVGHVAAGAGLRLIIRWRVAYFFVYLYGYGTEEIHTLLG